MMETMIMVMGETQAAQWKLDGHAHLEITQLLPYEQKYVEMGK
jgi:hypothetical protein